MNINIKVGHEIRGPYTLDQIKEEIEARRVSLTDLGAREGSTEWAPLMTVSEVVDAVVPKLPTRDQPNLPRPPVIPSTSGRGKEGSPSLGSPDGSPEPLAMQSSTSGRSVFHFRTLHLVIICATALLGAWIIKGSSKTTTITAPDGSVINVNVAAIEKLLKNDEELGTPIHQQISAIKIESHDDLDRMVALFRGYIDGARRLDTTSCPRDFAEAYYRHVSAWSEVAEAIDQHPAIQSGVESFLEGVLRGLGGDPTGGAFEKQDEVKRWLQRIQTSEAEVKRTWEETEALAIRYGARLAKQNQ